MDTLPKAISSARRATNTIHNHRFFTEAMHGKNAPETLFLMRIPMGLCFYKIIFRIPVPCRLLAAFINRYEIRQKHGHWLYDDDSPLAGVHMVPSRPAKEATGRRAGYLG
jgi:hypothetical protein